MKLLIISKIILFMAIVSLGSAKPSRVHIHQGRNAAPNSHPWLLTLTHATDNERLPFCSANLIRVPYLDGSSDIAVTAAHCFEPLEEEEKKTIVPEITCHDQDGIQLDTSYFSCEDEEFRTGDYEVIAGNHDQSTIDPGEVRAKVVNGRCHPMYNWDQVSDIALIKLETPIKFSQTIQPIDLPGFEEDLPGGTRCTIAGWGATEQQPGEDGFLEDVNDARILQEAEIRIETDSVCSSLYDRFTGYVQICDAIGSDPYTLEGDSGSALVCESEGRKKLFGVLSMGETNDEGKYLHDIFTEVRRFVYWIEETIRDLKK